MVEAARQYEISRAEFERALTLLERERESMRLSRAQKVSYQLYIIFVCGFVICLVGVFISVLVSIERTKPSAVGFSFSIGLALCFLGAILSLILNIPLMLKIGRQKWRLRKLGFSDASDVLWKAQQKTRRWVAVTGKIALYLGILFLGLGMLFLVVTVARGWGGRGRVGWWALWNFLFAIVLVVFYFLQKGKAWLDMVASRWTDITRLKASMLDLKKSAERAGADRISVPSETIERFCQIETETIVRSRAQAISEMAMAPRSNLSILSSRDVLEAKSVLDAESRLKVEEAIEGLMLEPRPSGVEEDAKTGFLRRRVNGTDQEIVYAVDDAERRLRLVTLRRVTVPERGDA